MKYPPKWKDHGVKLVQDREVYYRDFFGDRDVFVGTVTSKSAPGTKTAGGMVTNTAWVATRKEGGVCTFTSKTAAINWLLGLSTSGMTLSGV